MPLASAGSVSACDAYGSRVAARLFRPRRGRAGSQELLQCREMVRRRLGVWVRVASALGLRYDARSRRNASPTEAGTADSEKPRRPKPGKTWAEGVDQVVRHRLDDGHDAREGSGLMPINS